MSTTGRKGRWFAGFVLLPVVALVLSACVPPKPAPGPAPAPAQASTKASATADFDRAASWDSEVGEKERPPATGPTCNGATHQIAIEQCHLTYRSYNIDNSSNAAQATAEYIAARITPTQCSTPASSPDTSLDDYHTGRPLNPGSLGDLYPSASSASENLYCLYFTPPGCAGIQLGATNAINGWKNSPGHKANMDSILSPTVNGGGACFPIGTAGGGNSVYVAVAHFHNP